RIRSGQILRRGVEAQVIALGKHEREALMPVARRLVVKPQASRNAPPLRALIRVGEKSRRRTRHAETRIFVARRQPQLCAFTEAITEIRGSRAILVIVIAVTPVGPQVREAD